MVPSLFFLLPHSKTADECIRVVAEAAAGRHLLQVLGIASADDAVVEQKRGCEPINQELNGFTPLLLAELP